METHQPFRNQRNSFILFIALAYGITWVCWIPALMIADQQGYALPTVANFTQLLESGYTNPQHVLLSILFSLAVYGPLIAAVVVTLLESGRKGLGDLVGRIVKWRVSVKWYAWIVGIAVFLPLVPRLIGALMGLIQSNAAGMVWSLPLLLVVFLWQVMSSGLGEEPGWRGYALPWLKSRYDSDKAIWILGLIWAVWHYPFTIFDTLSRMGDVPMIGVVLTLAMALAGQTMSLIGMTYIYAWLYNQTRSVFIAVLFHALSNFMPAVLLGGAAPGLTLMVAVMPWVAVVALEKIYGKDRFPGEG